MECFGLSAFCRERVEAMRMPKHSLHWSSYFSRGLMAVFKTLKSWFFFYLLFLVTFSECFVPEYEAVLNKIDSERASAPTQEQAAQDVLARLLPNHVSSFELRIITKVHFAFLGFRLISWAITLLIFICSTCQPYTVARDFPTVFWLVGYQFLECLSQFLSAN